MPRSKPSRINDGVATIDADVAVAAQPFDAGAGARAQVAPSHEKEPDALGRSVVDPDDEFWSFKAVVAKTGLSRSSIYSYVAQGLFPRQRRLGPRRVGWLASEVRGWIASRPL